MRYGTIQALLLCVFGIPSLCTGCAYTRAVHKLDCCAEIPAGSIPEPAGAKLCRWQTAQVENAASDQRVLYQCDFVGSSEQLSPEARQRLWRYVQQNGAEVAAWTVEPSFKPNIDSARLNFVANTLAEMGAAGDVALALPAAQGLEGPFAEASAAAIGNARGGQGRIGGNTGFGSGVGSGVAGGQGRF